MIPPLLEIRRARPEEASILTAISFAAKRHWGYPEQWVQAWRDVLTIDAKFISEHETFAACIDNQPVGLYSLAGNLQGMSLEHLWVVPSAMGRGVGRALFNHAVEQAKALGAKAIEIEADPNAQAFYERMGATQVSTRTTDLDGQARIVPVLIYQIPDQHES